MLTFPWRGHVDQPQNAIVSTEQPHESRGVKELGTGFLTSLVGRRETTFSSVQNRSGHPEWAFVSVFLICSCQRRLLCGTRWSNLLHMLAPVLRHRFRDEDCSGMDIRRISGIRLIVLMGETCIETHDSVEAKVKAVSMGIPCKETTNLLISVHCRASAKTNRTSCPQIFAGACPGRIV